MHAIGFFDSGVGGLSIWREAVALLPQESTVYLADNAHCPYGTKTEPEIIERCKANTDFLLAQRCEMIVVACNTATAAAIDFLATSETLRGRLFQETSSRLRPDTEILVKSVEGWVEAVERGDTEPTPATMELVRSQIAPLLEQGVDGLVLGCTHFPFLRDVIAKIAGPNVRLYDPAKAVARQIRKILAGLGKDSSRNLPRHDFFCTGSPAPLNLMLGKLLPNHHAVPVEGKTQMVLDGHKQNPVAPSRHVFP